VRTGYSLQDPLEMEDILGFMPGFFASGVSVWRLNGLPTAAQFELRGYTNTPGGEAFDGIVLRRSGLPRPQFFTKDGAPAVYIPGLAVEQWQLADNILVPAVELERVLPGQQFTKWN